MPDKFYGNELAKKTLSSILKSGRICHAYLITGDNGLGKKTFARHFAKSLLCKGNSNKPCDNCDSCLKADTLNHPDIITLSGKPAKNSIHIDKIRELRQDAYIFPNESDHKIYIIESAENMTIGAVNALLKVLEEPPAHAMFILTAKSTTELYDTIVSRCIEIALISVSDENVKDALLSKDFSAEDIAQAVLYSNGNIGTAIKMLGDNEYTQLYDSAVAIAEGLISRNEYEILRAFSCCGKERSKIKSTFELLLEILRNAIVSTNNTANENDIAYRLSHTIIQSDLIKTAEIIINACERIDKNANTALLLSHIVAEIKT